MKEYEKQLLKACIENPGMYTFPPSEVPKIAQNMKKAFIARTYNKDGLAVIGTCKFFKIKHTYKAINAYFDKNP